jgi:hypothetical protein
LIFTITLEIWNDGLVAFLLLQFSIRAILASSNASISSSGIAIFVPSDFLAFRIQFYPLTLLWAACQFISWFLRCSRTH